MVCGEGPADDFAKTGGGGRMGNGALRRRKLEFSNISRGFSAFFSGLLLVLLLASPCAAQTYCDWRDGTQCEQPVLECDGSTCIDPAQQQPAPTPSDTCMSWLCVFLIIFALIGGYVWGRQRPPKEVPRKNKQEILDLIKKIFTERRDEVRAHGSNATPLLDRTEKLLTDAVEPKL
jgi:hypothetical protein